jgi:hypothetical protein
MGVTGGAAVCPDLTVGAAGAATAKAEIATTIAAALGSCRH